MLAYGQVYEAKRRTILYAHHLGLADHPGVIATFTMPSNDVTLEIATVDVAQLKSVPVQCLSLIAGADGTVRAAAV